MYHKVLFYFCLLSIRKHFLLKIVFNIVTLHISQALHCWRLRLLQFDTWQGWGSTRVWLPLHTPLRSSQPPLVWCCPTLRWGHSPRLCAPLCPGDKHFFADSLMSELCTSHCHQHRTPEPACSLARAPGRKMWASLPHRQPRPWRASGLGLHQGRESTAGHARLLFRRAAVASGMPAPRDHPLGMAVGKPGWSRDSAGWAMQRGFVVSLCPEGHPSTLPRRSLVAEPVLRVPHGADVDLTFQAVV